MRVSSEALRRAGALVAVGLLIAATCLVLGRWQWDKHVTRDTSNATIAANWSAPAVPLAALVPTAGDVPAARQEWRQVTATGHYLAEASVLLRNRPVSGTPAYHVLVPFQVDGGAVLVVDRGWVALGASGTTSAAVSAPPAGDVQLVARLRMPEPPSARSAPPGQVQNVDPGQVLAAGGLASSAVPYRWYAGVVSEAPAPATALGALPPPTTDPGPYLSYAVQWWAFALAGLLAFAAMARREALDDVAGRARAASRSTPPAAALPPADVPSAADAPSGPARPDGATPAVPAQPDPATPGTAQPAPATPPVPAAAPLPARGHGSGPSATRPPAPRDPRPARRHRGHDEVAEDALIDAQLPDGRPGPGAPAPTAPRT